MSELKAATRNPDWELELGDAPKRLEASYRLRLITPMIGGGARPGQPDAHNPIRPSAIRGHLRFWWRALQVNGHGLKEREAALWGSAERPGAVSLRVEVPEAGEIKSLNQELGAELPKYVTGVLIGRGSVLMNAQFNMVLEARPSLSNEAFEEAERAVRAWITFGGLGARVRRGAGSIGLREAKVSDTAQIHRGLIGPPNDNVEALTSLQGASLFLGPRCDNANRAWHGAVALIEGFRKGVPASEAMKRITVALKAGTYHRYPGGKGHHTPWIEADSIRATNGQATLRRRPNLAGRLHLPRARLGMPFTIRMTGSGRVEPGTFTTSRNQGELRLASPAIVKAIQFGDCFVPALLILNQPFAGAGISLKGTRGQITFEATIPPEGSGLKPQPDVCDMLAEYAVQAGWLPVKP